MISCKRPVRYLEFLPVLLLVGSSIAFGQSVTVISPNGLQRWVSSTQRTILFSTPSIANVRIEFGTNSGATWQEIIASTSAASGLYA
jgi:hypothetical protein